MQLAYACADGRARDTLAALLAARASLAPALVDALVLVAAECLDAVAAKAPKDLQHHLHEIADSLCSRAWEGLQQAAAAAAPEAQAQERAPAGA